MGKAASYTGITILLDSAPLIYYIEDNELDTPEIPTIYLEQIISNTQNRA